MNPGVRLHVRRQHSQFWPILTRFVDYYSPFGGLEEISMVVEPQGAPTCRSSTLIVWPILARFVDYYSLFCGPGVISMIDEPRGAFVCQSSPLTVYSLFWGPRAISMIDDPRGAFTCSSSTLIVSANSDPFRGLLLAILGSRSNFHSC